MDVKGRMKELGEGIVNEAFDDLFSYGIPSPMANRVLKRFSHWWRDYTRAALIVMSCQSVGGDPKLVFPAAKSLVLAGGAFDLHDDIIDKSFIRRKTRTKSIQGRYGLEATLLAGDALLIGGLVGLAEMPGLSERTKREVVAEITKGLFELGSAEMEELAFVHNLDTTPRKYIRILWMKASDMKSYTKVGAMIGNGSKEEVDALGVYGQCLGMICILRDELEDTFNDLYELRSRISNESLPLPIVYSLKDRKCRSLLTALFKKPSDEISDEELERLIEFVDQNHGFEKGQALINKYVRRAKAESRKLRDPEPFISLFQ